MKAVAVAVLTVGLGAVGAAKMLGSDPDDSRKSANTPAAAATAEKGKMNCWPDSKIKKDRFSLRGGEGSIRSFEIDKVGGCVFRVKLEYSTAMGATKSLDFDAEYAAGDRPIFIRYHAPP